MHLSDEDLILHYYREADDEPRIERHLTECAACAAEFAKLGRVLAMVDDEAIPEPGPAFERSMWARVEPLLAARRTGLARWLGPFADAWSAAPRMRWVYAGGLAVLLVAAFMAGRVSRPPVETPAVAVAEPAADDRVLLVAVVDHLDRSQMVLVELLNGEGTNPAAMDAEQSRARELVTANRLYRQSAAQYGNAMVGETLDDLERVLLEIANAPADMTADEFEQLKRRIAGHGLLFRVRVVQSEMREQQRQQIADRIES
jgi:hypothetical protein